MTCKKEVRSGHRVKLQSATAESKIAMPATSHETELDKVAAAVCALVRTERTVRTYPRGNELSERALADRELG